VPERGGARDVAKVVDFGLVRDVEQETEAGDGDGFAGTPLYIAPESVTGPDAVDARSDLYSLGCVGYFLLTGRPVFERETVIELVGSHLHTQPTPPDQRIGRPVPASLSALILSCLEKDPARRPPSALACIAALDACGDVPPWTDEQASAWWSIQGARLLARASDTRVVPATTEATITRLRAGV
jgi:serine/threonine protein kinase